MRMYDIIKKKRDGGELSKAETDFFVKGYVDGTVADYQASALCMAIFFNGMTENETVNLTLAMANSGDTLDLSKFGNRTVDKHSTGGVGDKTTLIVAPIAASLGCITAKISGRGLGHTGGTVDKLDSVKGFKTTLSQEEFFAQIEKTGIAVIGQTGNFTPADKKLYALRDVTATVDSMPLIASSIMSKKIAAGAHTIVLDVKYGSGAFMKTPQDAECLAHQMVKIGENCGRNVCAVITNMNTPLGNNIGNSLEVAEAVDLLNGKGPADLKEVCLTLATQMVALSENIPVSQARILTEDALNSGKALKKFKEWMVSQGAEDGSLCFEEAAYKYEIRSPFDGYIDSTDAEKIGTAAVLLGAGREKKDDIIDPDAGIVLCKKTCDKVTRGDVLAFLYSNNENSFASAEKTFLSAISFSKKRPPVDFPIYKII